MKEKHSYNYIYILLLPMFIFINYILSFFPFAVESAFSTSLNKVVIKFISTLTSLVGISIAEIIVISFVLFSIVYTFLFLKAFFTKTNKFFLFKTYFLKILLFFTFIYISFLLLWGFNYNRLPFSTIANLRVEPTSVSELESLCKDLIKRTNNLRQLVIEDQNGVMFIKDGIDGVLLRAEKGYDNISKHIPELEGKLGRPKRIFFSKALNYTGIAGIYFPFTAEANVNTAIPLLTLPSTTSHEMAHQRGFAREDEANYIAYLTCSVHPDVDFQYSGTLLALIHSMNALYKYDTEKYLQLRSLYSDGLKRDLAYISNFWKQFEGPVERTSSKINNAYLKSNLQKDGVYSYGRMVDLLLAQYRIKQEAATDTQY